MILLRSLVLSLGLGAVAGAVLPRVTHAQVPVRRDTIKVPIPAKPDSTGKGDTTVKSVVPIPIAAKRDTVPRDTLKRPLARAEGPEILEVGALPREPHRQLEYKRVMGGLLVQDRDVAAQLLTLDQLQTVSKRAPSAQELQDLLFAWRVVACVKSNAIVYARERRTIGIGAGQMSRVYSARIAAIKAADEGLEVVGSVMASDAFFPFRDGIDAAAAAGIRAVIQPGGSMRDNEVIAAADEHGMAMVFTGERHFRH